MLIRRGVLAVALAVTAGAGLLWHASRDTGANRPPGRLVDIGGYRLHLLCAGAGTPTVLLEAGLGGSVVEWRRVQPRLAQFTRVCAYDRAGLGYSDPGPRPRTAQQMVQELATLLDRDGIAGPLVIVGASLGGYIARLFATRYPARVNGLVLVDASHEDQELRLRALASDVLPSTVGGLVPVVSGLTRSRLFRTVVGVVADAAAHSSYIVAADELIYASDSAEEVRASRRMLTIPLTIISAGRPPAVPGLSPATTARFAAVLDDLQRDQLHFSTRACRVVAAQAGHRVAQDQPSIVVQAVRTIVEAARRGADAIIDHCRHGGNV